MNVLVVEYVTGGGMADRPLPSILADAEIIRRAQLDDMAAIPGVEVHTLLDARLALDAPPRVMVQRVGPGAFDARFDQTLDDADGVWLTAPETHGVLEALSRRVMVAGCRLLGCAPETVGVTASKRATARTLEQADIASVPTYDDPGQIASGPIVVKPDDGAGCETTRVFLRHHEAMQWAASVLGSRAVYQPWVEGEPLSLSLLCANGQAELLAVNRQHINLRGGVFSFAGVTVNVYAGVRSGYAALGSRIAQAMPGLWGHVGVDVLHTAQGPMVVEVNPRATVSYAGLRRALGFNPAAALLELPCMPAPRHIHSGTSVSLEFDHVVAPA